MKSLSICSIAAIILAPSAMSQQQMSDVLVSPHRSIEKNEALPEIFSNNLRGRAIRSLEIWMLQGAASELDILSESEFQTLEELTIWISCAELEPSQLKPLAEMPRLKKVSISANLGARGIDAIPRIPSLEVLVLWAPESIFFGRDGRDVMTRLNDKFPRLRLLQVSKEWFDQNRMLRDQLPNGLEVEPVNSAEPLRLGIAKLEKCGRTICIKVGNGATAGQTGTPK